MPAYKLTTSSWTLPQGTGEVVKKVRFTESQIVAVSREGEAGIPVAELALENAAIKDVLSRKL
jgi:hypothetical protein